MLVIDAPLLGVWRVEEVYERRTLYKAEQRPTRDNSLWRLLLTF
jgi:hypothetical protein